MKKFVRIIDENGLFQRDEFVEKLTEFTIEEPCQGGFYLPKWDGSKWVEGLSDEEIQALQPSISYDQLVSDLIRAKYTVDQEIAINRQRDTKPKEFQAYFDFCERCKIKAHEQIL